MHQVTVLTYFIPLIYPYAPVLLCLLHIPLSMLTLGPICSKLCPLYRPMPNVLFLCSIFIPYILSMPHVLRPFVILLLPPCFLFSFVYPSCQLVPLRNLSPHYDPFHWSFLCQIYALPMLLTSASSYIPHMLYATMPVWPLLNQFCTLCPLLWYFLTPHPMPEHAPIPTLCLMLPSVPSPIFQLLCPLHIIYSPMSFLFHIPHLPCGNYALCP